MSRGATRDRETGHALPVERLCVRGAELSTHCELTRSPGQRGKGIERTFDSGSIEMRRLRSSLNHQCSSPCSPRDSRAFVLTTLDSRSCWTWEREISLRGEWEREEDLEATHVPLVVLDVRVVGELPQCDGRLCGFRKDPTKVDLQGVEERGQRVRRHRAEGRADAQRSRCPR